MQSQRRAAVMTMSIRAGRIINHKSQIINLKSRGFTLLEVLLSLFLATLVLMAVAMAIDVNMRVLNAGRADVEEAQLARALLGRIADDLRGAVQYDPAQIAKMAASASGGSGGGGGSASSSGSGTSGTSSSGTSGTSGASGGTGGTGGPSTNKSGTGGTSGGSGTSGGGGSGTSGGTGASGGTSTSSGVGTGGTVTPVTGDSSQSSTTSGLSSSAVIPSVPGLYGNQYELQVDVSRMPRMDQLAAVATAQSGEQLADRPSEVKTVTYYLQDNGAAGGLSAATASAGSGLVRRELDRLVAAWATQQGTLSDSDLNQEPIAPEVIGLEFGYFDGSQWLTEWDSLQNGGLPVAVEISLSIDRSQLVSKKTSSSWLSPFRSGNDALQQINVYHLIVYLPGSRPSTASSGSTSTGSSDTGSGSGSGSSTSGGTSQQGS